MYSKLLITNRHFWISEVYLEIGMILISCPIKYLPHQKRNSKNWAIDLRNNGGGNSMLIDKILEYIKDHQK